MHYLVIDTRFRVPVFVFLETDPTRAGPGPGLPVRGVSLDRAASPAGRPGADNGMRPNGAIGQDPDRPDRFLEFPSDGHVRAAGFGLIEPRYVGPSWEAYLSVFRPEGDRASRAEGRRPPRPAARAPAPRPERT